MAHRVTFIPGDGIGPELSEAVQRVLEATGVAFEWDFQSAGLDVHAREGTPLPQRVLDSVRRNKVAIKAPISTPIGAGFRSVNVALRKEFDLYACVRPCRAYAGVATPFPDTDLVIVRENLEDLYAGIEFEVGSEKVLRLREMISEWEGIDVAEDSAISIKPISRSGSKRIAEYAFGYAREHDFEKVTVVHKANIMKFTDGLFLSTAKKVAAEYADVACDERIVDNLCQQLVLRPETFGVILLPNLYGDIVSDIAAGLIGGLGLAPGANIGDEYAIFEATHGSAPDIAGQNKANPIAMVLSGVMMLDHLGETAAAASLERAVAAVIGEGRHLTADLRSDHAFPAATTSEVADAIIAQLS